MKVVVTGASGFVGRHLTRALAAAGHDVVTDTDAHRAALDLVDRGVADTLVRDADPDAVVHLAARAGPRDDPWRALLRNNELSALRVLDAVKQHAPHARVLVASSSAVYGAVPRDRNPVRETEPLRPVTMYGASKAGTEAIAFAFAASGLRVTVCRPFNTIGPGGDKRSALAQWTRRLLELESAGGHDVFRCGPLNTFRDLTDVRDMARGYVSLVEHHVSEPVVNLCSGRAVEGTHVLDLLCAAIGVRPQVIAAQARADDIMFQSGDNSRIAAATGWGPSIELEQTVEDVVREQRHVVSV
jgi:GDP-4-dehydro-6-deoxy-D-mannose reductase